MRKKRKISLKLNPQSRFNKKVVMELFSYDKNNNLILIELFDRANNKILLDAGSTVKILCVFEKSNKTWETVGENIDGQIAFRFDTSLISQDEYVTCYIYLNEENEVKTDVASFMIYVRKSEIHKEYDPKESTENTDNRVLRLSDLKNIQSGGVVDTSNFATKNELPDMSLYVEKSKFDDISRKLDIMEKLIIQREQAYIKLVEENKLTLAMIKTGTVPNANQQVGVEKINVTFDIIKDTYIERTGNSVAFEGWSETDYIDVSDADFVNFIKGGVTSYNAWYDSEKRFISIFAKCENSLIEKPANAHYCRLSNQSGALASLQVEKWKFKLGE